MFIGLNISAQDKMFVHTVTPANTYWSYASRIDHPDLNGNPDARLIISHTTVGTIGEPNTQKTGVLYYENYWHVFNENWTAITNNTSYTIYIPDSTHSFEHLIESANNASNIDETLVNGNPDKNVVITHNHIDGASLNNLHVGLVYEAGVWSIISESLADIPSPSTYFVAADGEAGIDGLRVTASEENLNTLHDCMIVQHAALNGNPDGKFVFTHFIGNVILLDKAMTRFYANNEWRICTEDFSEIEVGTQFNLLIDNSHMATQEFENSNVSVCPNPVSDVTHFNSKSPIQKISIYNLAGKLIQNYNFNSDSVKIDFSKVPVGVYIAKIQTKQGIKTLKLIKN